MLNFAFYWFNPCLVNDKINRECRKYLSFAFHIVTNLTWLGVSRSCRSSGARRRRSCWRSCCCCCYCCCPPSSWSRSRCWPPGRCFHWWCLSLIPGTSPGLGAGQVSDLSRGGSQNLKISVVTVLGPVSEKYCHFSNSVRSAKCSGKNVCMYSLEFCYWWKMSADFCCCWLGVAWASLEGKCLKIVWFLKSGALFCIEINISRSLVGVRSSEYTHSVYWDHNLVRAEQMRLDTHCHLSTVSPLDAQWTDVFKIFSFQSDVLHGKVLQSEQKGGPQSAKTINYANVGFLLAAPVGSCTGDAVWHTGHPGTYAGVSVCIKRVFTVRALDTEWPHSALSLSAQSSRAAWLGPSSAGLARAGCWAITGFTLHTLISTEQKNTQDTPASQGLHMECKHAQTFILSTKQITCLKFARKNNGVKSSSMMMTVRSSRVANLAQSEASDEVS